MSARPRLAVGDRVRLQDGSAATIETWLPVGMSSLMARVVLDRGGETMRYEFQLTPLADAPRPALRLISREGVTR